MAASAVMQSILVSQVAGGVRSSNRISRNCFAPLQRRSSSVVVRCMAEDGKKERAGPGPTPPSATGPSPAAAGPSSPTPTPPPQKPKGSRDFFDLLAFSGPAPERINGRLAMIGFVAALAVEFLRGEDVFAQIADGGASWFLLTTVVLSVASLIPLSSGVTVEEKSQEIMSSDAEMWNGRFAMLGLVALAFTEFVKGGALIA